MLVPIACDRHHSLCYQDLLLGYSLLVLVGNLFRLTRDQDDRCGNREVEEPQGVVDRAGALGQEEQHGRTSQRQGMVERASVSRVCPEHIQAGLPAGYYSKAIPNLEIALFFLCLPYLFPT